MLDPSLLSNLPAFDQVGREDIRDILAQAAVRRHEIGSDIFSEGEEADAFFLLLDGYVRVRRITPDGEPVIIRYIPPGQLIGIAAAIGKTHYPATAEAAAECLTLAWPMPLLMQFMAKYPGFGQETSRAIGVRIAEAHDRIAEQTTQHVEQRLANALLRLIEQGGKATPEGIEIDFAVGRSDLAEFSGTTLHTTSRTMSAWEKDGIVKSARKRVTICDKDRLSTYANPTRID